MQAELPHMAAEKEDTDKVKKSAGKSKKPKAEEEVKKVEYKLAIKVLLQEKFLVHGKLKGLGLKIY